MNMRDTPLNMSVSEKRGRGGKKQGRHTHTYTHCAAVRNTEQKQKTESLSVYQMLKDCRFLVGRTNNRINHPSFTQ